MKIHTVQFTQLLIYLLPWSCYCSHLVKILHTMEAFPIMNNMRVCIFIWDKEEEEKKKKWCIKITCFCFGEFSSWYCIQIKMISGIMLTSKDKILRSSGWRRTTTAADVFRCFVLVVVVIALLLLLSILLLLSLLIVWLDMLNQTSFPCILQMISSIF